VTDPIQLRKTDSISLRFQNVMDRKLSRIDEAISIGEKLVSRDNLRIYPSIANNYDPKSQGLSKK